MMKNNIYNQRSISSRNEKPPISYFSQGEVFHCVRKQSNKRITTEPSQIIVDSATSLTIPFHNKQNNNQQSTTKHYLNRHKSDCFDSQNNQQYNPLVFNKSIIQKITSINGKIAAIESKIDEINQKESNYLKRSQIESIKWDINNQKNRNWQFIDMFKIQLIQMQKQIKIQKDELQQNNKNQFQSIVNKIQQIIKINETNQKQIKDCNLKTFKLQKTFNQSSQNVKTQLASMLQKIQILNITKKVSSSFEAVTDKHKRDRISGLHQSKNSLEPKHYRTSSCLNSIETDLNFSCKSLSKDYHGMYFIDQDCYLLDTNGFYILNTLGNPIKLQRQDVSNLKSKGMMS